jgi:hypothetical protein
LLGVIQILDDGSVKGNIHGGKAGATFRTPVLLSITMSAAAICLFKSFRPQGGKHQADYRDGNCHPGCRSVGSFNHRRINSPR